MTFWLKKLISAFLLPLPIGLILIALGFLFLLINRCNRLRLFFSTIGLCLILLFSLNPVAYALLNQLQMRYLPLMAVPADANQIVVLGGGVSGGKNYPPNITLNSASLSRLVEGIRLLSVVKKNHPNVQFILSGGRVFRSPAVAGKMRNTAEMLGVDRKNIILEDGSQDTYQEALFLKKQLGDKPFILVTSAYHMPRAMDLFEGLGMHPVAAPTQYYHWSYDPALKWVPSANAVVISDIAIHEYLGILWAKIRGYIR